MDALQYYAEPGLLTTMDAAVLPSAVPELFDTVRAMLEHEPGSARSVTGHFRATREILEGVRTAAPRPLRGCCRHFTLVAVAALRSHGVPARARCGFARYFVPDWHLDHWVVEYWDAAEQAWLLGDPQLDQDFCRRLGVTFDPGDVPRNQFVVAGDAWTRCRTGALDPSRCGIPGEGRSGWWWVAGNLVRDIAALSKMELLPWDVWGDMPGPGDPVADTVAAKFDRAAAVTADPATAAEGRAWYPDDSFRVPPRVYNVLRQREESVLPG